MLYSGSDAGIVKVWNMNTDAAISKFRNADPAGSGPASRRDAGAVHTIKSMMFHPHEMSLAVGATDTRVNVSDFRVSYFACREQRSSFSKTFTDLQLPTLIPSSAPGAALT